MLKNSTCNGRELGIQPLVAAFDALMFGTSYNLMFTGRLAFIMRLPRR
jgi:hypothetical protein